MLTKLSLKTELKLPTTQIINELLKSAGASSQKQKSRNIDDVDAELVRAAVPFWKKGYPYLDCITLAKEALAHQPQTATGDAKFHQSPDSFGGASSGDDVGAGEANSNQIALLEQKAASQALANQQKRQQARNSSLLTKVTSDAQRDEQMYWLLLAAASGSKQVQQSESVQQAKDFYFAASSGQLEFKDELAHLCEESDFFWTLDSENLLNPASEVPVESIPPANSTTPTAIDQIHPSDGDDGDSRSDDTSESSPHLDPRVDAIIARLRNAFNPQDATVNREYQSQRQRQKKKIKLSAFPLLAICCLAMIGAIGSFGIVLAIKSSSLKSPQSRDAFKTSSEQTTNSSTAGGASPTARQEKPFHDGTIPELSTKPIVFQVSPKPPKLTQPRGDIKPFARGTGRLSPAQRRTRIQQARQVMDEYQRELGAK